MEDENPYAAPQADLEEAATALTDESLIRRRDKMLLVPVDARLPRRCVSCNRPASHRLQVSVAEQSDPKTEISPWWAVAAIAVGFLILAAGCAGIQLPFGDSDVWWSLFPIVLVTCMILPLVLQRRRFSKITFYLCPWHRIVRASCSLLTTLLVSGYFLLMIAGRIHLTDLDWFDESMRFPRFAVWFGLLQIGVWTPMIFHTQIWSKGRVGELHAIKGLGSRFLENFPTMDEQETSPNNL